jgi:hypothetical protein
MKQFFLLYLILVAVAPTPVVFSAVTNTLVLEKGKVKIRRNNIDRVYRKVGEVIILLNKDKIQTAADTFVKIHLAEKGDDIELFSHSFFQVSISKAKGENISMPIGKAFFKIKKRTLINKKKRFKVKTANAIVGVRGTDFIISAGEGETNLLTLSGIVDMANAADPDVVVEVAENEVSQTRQNARPTVPIVVPPQVRNQILNSDSSKSFNNVKFGPVVKPPKNRKAAPKKKKVPTKKEDKKEDKKDPKKDEKKDPKKEEDKEDPKKEDKTPVEEKTDDKDNGPKETDESKATGGEETDDPNANTDNEPTPPEEPPITETSEPEETPAPVGEEEEIEDEVPPPDIEIIEDEDDENLEDIANDDLEEVLETIDDEQEEITETIDDEKEELQEITIEISH